MAKETGITVDGMDIYLLKALSIRLGLVFKVFKKREMLKGLWHNELSL